MVVHSPQRPIGDAGSGVVCHCFHRSRARGTGSLNVWVEAEAEQRQAAGILAEYLTCTSFVIKRFVSENHSVGWGCACGTIVVQQYLCGKFLSVRPCVEGCVVTR